MIVMWNRFLWDDFHGVPQETITSMSVIGTLYTGAISMKTTFVLIGQDNLVSQLR